MLSFPTDEPTRHEWVCTRNPRSLSGVFQPGWVMRCPLARTRKDGRLATCGGDLGRAPLWVREAVVRGPVGLPPIPNAEHERRTCGSCCKTLDVFLVRQAQSLEATG